jgi:hypothetical protein
VKKRTITDIKDIPPTIRTHVFMLVDVLGLIRGKKNGG